MKKPMLKKIIWASGLLLGLGISYYLCRYAFLYVHHMTDWAELLAVVSLIILLAAMLFSMKWMSVTAAFGYMFGFVLAVLFNTNGVDPGGGRTNNFWSIWTFTMALSIFTGLIVDIAVKARRANRGER